MFLTPFVPVKINDTDQPDLVLIKRADLMNLESTKARLVEQVNRDFNNYEVDMGKLNIELEVAQYALQIAKRILQEYATMSHKPDCTSIILGDNNTCSCGLMQLMENIFPPPPAKAIDPYDCDLDNDDWSLS